jgi:hypothetical protein
MGEGRGGETRGSSGPNRCSCATVCALPGLGEEGEEGAEADLNAGREEGGRGREEGKRRRERQWEAVKTPSEIILYYRLNHSIWS